MVAGERRGFVSESRSGRLLGPAANLKTNMQKSEFRYSFVGDDYITGVVVASEPFLALRHASGVFAHRTITGYRESYDATQQLREFCRWCAAKMLPHWPQAPALFLEWCATGDANLDQDLWVATRVTPPADGPCLVVQSALWVHSSNYACALLDNVKDCSDWTVDVLHDVEPVRDEFNRLIANGFE